MLKAHRFHVKFTVHTIMSEGGDVTMEEITHSPIVRKNGNRKALTI